MTEPGEFFDRIGSDYRESRVGDPYAELVAERLHAGLSGTVLGIGGLWEGFELPAAGRVIVADPSTDMLAALPRDVEPLVADARSLPLPDASVDHIVLSLVLHHITGRGAFQSRSAVRQALVEGARVLKPGGRIWIREWVTPRPVYAVELLAAPLTQRLLGLAGVPLVVMHSQQFYERALHAAGFDDVQAERPHASADRPLEFVAPVLGLPWFRIPRVLYPVTAAFITAARRA